MAKPDFKVAVVGAGIAGLFMAEKLKRAGVEFTVFEKADEVGGTWRDNTYPGLYVDVLSRQYEFPFQPNYDWSRKYAPGTEIQAYVKKVAADRGLRKFVRFTEEIVEAKFAGGRWHLTTAKGEAITADVFVAATGFLHQPVYPDIPGRESFSGPAFHSARWDHSVPYNGKTVGHHRRRCQRHPDHRGAGVGRLRGDTIHPPRRSGCISAKIRKRRGANGSGCGYRSPIASASVNSGT